MGQHGKKARRDRPTSSWYLSLGSHTRNLGQGSRRKQCSDWGREYNPSLYLQFQEGLVVVVGQLVVCFGLGFLLFFQYPLPPDLDIREGWE